jgi:hypothetical protein
MCTWCSHIALAFFSFCYVALANGLHSENLHQMSEYRGFVFMGERKVSGIRRQVG